MASIVSIANKENIKRAIPDALNSLGDLSDLFEGKHVAIKPNDTWASRDDLTACTQADTLEAVVRYVKRFGPSKITVSGGAGAAETGDVFELLGFDKVIKKEGVEFFDHNRPPFKSVQLQYGPQNAVMVNPHILEYDVVVSLAQHKVHDDAIVSLTMKNTALSFPAADYYGHPRERQLKPHRFFEDLHGFIVGMCKRFPSKLGIIAGHPAMIGNGPIGGETFESGIVVASRDCVAADAIGARLLGFETVRYIEAAEKQGLGTAALEEIKVAGVPLFEAAGLFKSRSRMIRVRV